MRRVVLGLGMSLDGYIARPDGSVDFLFMPKDFSMGPFFKTVDTTLMGRKTYEAGLRMSGGSFSTHGLATYVLSRSLAPGERNGLIFCNDSPRAIVESLRKRKGKNIWHMGGGELARAFLEDDLIATNSTSAWSLNSSARAFPYSRPAFRSAASVSSKTKLFLKA